MGEFYLGKNFIKSIVATRGLPEREALPSQRVFVASSTMPPFSLGYI